MARPDLGFMSASHRQPTPLRRVSRRLATTCPDAPILCHDDFPQARIGVAASRGLRAAPGNSAPT